MAAVSMSLVDIVSESETDAVLKFLNDATTFALPDGSVRAEHLAVQAFDSEFADEAWVWRLNAGAPRVLDAEVAILTGEVDGSAVRQAPDRHPCIHRGVVLLLHGGWSVAADGGDEEEDANLAEYAAGAITR